MKLIILKTIDGYQHSFLLPKLMTSVMAPGVLTTVGTEVPVAGEGMPSKHLLSYPCELSPQTPPPGLSLSKYVNTRAHCPAKLLDILWPMFGNSQYLSRRPAFYGTYY
jgi:hypothetical protein